MCVNHFIRLSTALLAPILLAGLFLLAVEAQANSPGRETQRAQAQSAGIEINIDQVIASGLNRPIQVTNAGDGSGRLFVVEQGGLVKIIKNRTVLSAPFIDLSGLVACCGERGLLSIAFQPDYASSGVFYVNYTRSGDGATVVARYQVSAGNPDIADPASARVIMTIPQPYSNHNGGQLMFSPADGYLYVGMGDGGSGGDPLNHGQDINTLLGALLRLDVTGTPTYTIPAGNPFVGTAGADEIWAIGLRNPWRFSFDRGNGDLYIGDVGQNAWEEIDYQAAGTTGGVNFGWRCKEGDHNYNFSGGCASAVLTDPIAEYSHSEGNSVTGGYIYRGSAYPDLEGRYFYADYVTGRIWSIYKTGPNPDTWSFPELELDTDLNITSFGEDEGGELYLASLDGRVRLITDANSAGVNLSNSSKQAEPDSADPGETVTYTVNISNTGLLLDRPVTLTDTIPSGLAYVPGSMWASAGSVDDTAAPQLTWEGNLSVSRDFTVTYQVEATGAVTGSLPNMAILSSPLLDPITLSASVQVPRATLDTTPNDFILPGTQPGELTAAIQDSIDCDICHSQPIYDRWRGSMMSQAGRDPLLWAALSVANADAAGAGEYCLRCHTPRGWHEGRSHPPDGSALQLSDISNGVTCNLCHRMVDPLASPSDEAAAIDQGIRGNLSNPVPLGFTGSSAIIVDPDDNRRGPFSFGLNLPYHSAYQTDFLRQTGDTVTRARMCGSCHNVYNPVLSWDESQGQFLPNGMDSPPPSLDQDQLFPIETTFDEWLYSDFARGGVYAPRFAGEKPDGVVRTCQDCHMRRSTGKAADEAFNPVLRDCVTSGCLPEHIFAGANTWVPKLLQNLSWRLNASQESQYLDETILEAELMLRKAADLSVSLSGNGGSKTASVRVTNQSGHKLPTGYPEGRQMWVNLRGYNARGDLIFESGEYDPLSGVLTRDAQSKVYEAKQGITPELAAMLPLPPGESFHFVLNNTVIKDNRIPPRGYTQALYDRPGLRPVGAIYLDGQNWDETTYNLPPETTRVVATLYYQTSSKEYIDFLRSNGGPDGQALGEMWEDSKSPPVLMAQAYDPPVAIYFPIVNK